MSGGNPNQFPGPMQPSPFSNPAHGHPYGAPPTKSGGSGLIIAVIVGAVLFGTLILVGILAALLLPAVGAAREAARRMADSNNMKQIGLAMHNYNDVVGHLPMPTVVSSSGDATFSWRAPLLPYIEQSMLAQELDLEQPWDGSENSLYSSTAIATLISPLSEDAGGPVSHYHLIVGTRNGNAPVPLFVEGEATQFRDVTDGLSNTIMAISLPNHSVPWAEPRNLTSDEAFQELSMLQGANVLFGDGSVRYISSSIDRETWDALVTRDGSEVINQAF